MDRLTLEVLAAHQPKRAILFTPPSKVGRTIECAKCALAYLNRKDNAAWNAAEVLNRSEPAPLRSPGEEWAYCFCGAMLEFKELKPL